MRTRQVKLWIIRLENKTCLTHWGRATHICVGKLTIIGSDNDLSPGRRQAIIWTSAGILLIGPLGTNFSEISIGIQTFSFKKIDLKMSSGKRRPFCPGLNVLTVRINSFLDQILQQILFIYEFIYNIILINLCNIDIDLTLISDITIWYCFESIESVVFYLSHTNTLTIMPN